MGAITVRNQQEYVHKDDETTAVCWMGAVSARGISFTFNLSGKVCAKQSQIEGKEEVASNREYWEWRMGFFDEYQLCKRYATKGQGSNWIGDWIGGKVGATT